MPPSNLDRNLSSNSAMAFGGLSEERIICLFFSYKELKTWKNSSWLLFLPAINCISSKIKTSIGARLALKDSILFVLMAETMLETNFSEDIYFTFFFFD